ncbi:MAG: hypothetical protein J6V83_01075 [Clostridia bacterium]|nr:hypothetical protein [Clostridia bacterium]MBO7155977.1 hypothetical protein [Clostridia bacterium]
MYSTKVSEAASGSIILSVFLFFMMLAAIVVINYIVARKFEDIAFSKGYDSSIHSFAMCFWLGIIGYIYVAALPDLKRSNNINNSSVNEQKSHNLSQIKIK